jgi:HAD superfamily hydrolase (TIGR01549 family)
MFIKSLFLDMDDTLHDFSNSAGMAMSKVYRHIVKKHDLSEQQLREAYRAIMTQTEKNAFFDGRTSREYRTERFARLLNTFDVQDERMVDELLVIYAQTLEENMKLYDGVMDVLSRLQKKLPMFIVTEGPSDAQRRAIKILGLSPFIKEIFISGEAKKIKETGELFEHALNQTGLSPNEVVLVGDSHVRDVVGGLKAGLNVVWLNTKGKVLRPQQEQPQFEISDITELETVLKKCFGLKISMER